MEPEPPGAAFFLLGAGADPIWSELESAPGLRTSRAGAAQKSEGSATRLDTFLLGSGDVMIPVHFNSINIMIISSQQA